MKQEYKYEKHIGVNSPNTTSSKYQLKNTLYDTNRSPVSYTTQKKFLEGSKSTRNAKSKKIFIPPDEYYDKIRTMSPENLSKPHGLIKSNDFFVTARSNFGRSKNKFHLNNLKKGNLTIKTAESIPFWLNIGMKENRDAVTNNKTLFEKTTTTTDFPYKSEKKIDTKNKTFSLSKSIFKRATTGQLKPIVDSLHHRYNMDNELPGFMSKKAS